jgi:hypothetical protein
MPSLKCSSGKFVTSYKDRRKLPIITNVGFILKSEQLSRHISPRPREGGEGRAERFNVEEEEKNEEKGNENSNPFHE